MRRSSYLIPIFAFCFVSINYGASLAENNADSSEETDAIQKLFEAIEDINNKLDALDNGLNAVQATLEQKITPTESKCLARDVTVAINNQQFDVAEEKLIELDDNEKIIKIVHDVYAGSAVNVNKIVSFAKALKSGESQFQVFSAVLGEIASDGNANPIEMMKLVQAFDREVGRRKDESLKIKSKAIIEEAIEDIKVASVTVFQTAMIANKYEKNVEIDNLADALFEFRTDVSNDVMDRVVDSVFGVVAAGKILDNISSHKNIPQVIQGLTSIFNRFKKARNLNNDATFNLALHLSKLQKRKNYGYLSQKIKDDLEKVIQQLPACARNIYSDTYVCLWNKAKEQYVYAAKEEIHLDKLHRNIYTWHEGDVPKSGAYWHVNRTGDAFYLRNSDHAEEYLLSPWDRFAWDKDQRFTYSLVSGNKTDPQSLWTIELDGEICYIKSIFNNEYLYASDQNADQSSSYVFSWRPGSLIRSPEFQWQFRNCNQN